MIQKIKGLSGLQMVALGVLVIMGVLFLVNSEPFRVERTEDVELGGYGFLQKGTYTAEVTYENVSAGSAVLVYSEEMPNEQGAMGVVYARQELQEGSGVVRVTFDLSQGTHDVWVGLAEEADGYLSKVIIQSNHLIHKDGYFVSVLLFLSAIVLLVCFCRLPSEKYMGPLVLVLLGVLAGLPMFSETLLRGDDIDFHLTRLEGLYLGLAAGEFPVRITPQQMGGYGSLTATMYPQLFLYPIALLRFLGVSLMGCYKFLCVLINVGTAFAAYYSVKNVSKSARLAMLMSVLYTFSAYRLSNLYVRGALGESLAMVFMPIVLWGVYEVLWGQRRWIVLVLGMTGILGSHVLSAELCAVFMILELVYWFFSKKKNQFGARFLDGVKAVVVTVLLNAFFLVPFFYYCGEPLQCFRLPFEDLSASVAYFSQMFALFPTATGGNLSAGSTMGEMSITIGAVLLLGMAVFVYVYGKNAEQSSVKSKGVHCLFYGVLALVLASWIFPWGKLGEVQVLASLCASLQFTWRFLGPATVFLCFVTAIGLDELLEHDRAKWICGVAAALLVVTTWSLFDSLATDREQYTDRMFLESHSVADGMYAYPVDDSFYPVQTLFSRRECVPVACYSTDISFENYRREGTHIYMEVMPQAGVQEDILFPLYYYPGYVVTVNGEEVPVMERDHLVCAEAPEEAAVVEAYYKGFWFFDVADVVTLLTFLGLVGLGIGKRLPRKKSPLAKVEA